MNQTDAVREAARELADAKKRRERAATAATKASQALEVAAEEERRAAERRDIAIREDSRNNTEIAKAAGLSRTRVIQIKNAARISEN